MSWQRHLRYKCLRQLALTVHNPKRERRSSDGSLRGQSLLHNWLSPVNAKPCIFSPARRSVLVYSGKAPLYPEVSFCTVEIIVTGSRMAFPFLPGNQGATEERLRYLYHLRHEIQQRKLQDNSLQLDACADISQADGTGPSVYGVPGDIWDENEVQHAEQTRRKMKHAAFTLLRPLRKLSLESLSAASNLNQTKSLPKGSEGSGCSVASQHPVSAKDPIV